MIEFEYASSLWLKPLIRKLRRIRDERRVQIEQISDTFGDCESLARRYVEPDCQHHNPTDWQEDVEPRSQLTAPVFKSLNKFLSGDMPLRGGRNQMFVLADAGMGKTSLLVVLKLYHLTAFWPQEYHCELLKLGPDTLDIVENLKNKSRTVLLLDALDEDPAAWGRIEDRLVELLDKTSEFLRVVISCRTQFFPRTGLDPFGNPGRVEVRGFICPMVFLSLFEEEHVEAYLRKRFPVRLHNPLTYRNRSLRKRAGLLVDKMASLRFRPLLLAHIEDILNAEDHEWDEFNVYGALIKSWLLREETKLSSNAGKSPSMEELWSVCVDIAIQMQKTGARTITSDQLNALVVTNSAAEHINAIDVGGRSLLNRNSAGNYRFAHFSVQEYLVATAVLGDEFDSNVLEELRITDQLLQFVDGGGGVSFDKLSILNMDDGQKVRTYDFVSGSDPGPALRLSGRPTLESYDGEIALDSSERVAIGVYLVSFDEYDLFVSETGGVFPDDHGWGRGRRPVVNVALQDAKSYCTWLSDKTGAHYFIPSEALWTQCVFGAVGASIPGRVRDYGWIGGETTQEVGLKLPVGNGVYDAIGNVWEFTDTNILVQEDGRTPIQRITVVGGSFRSSYIEGSRKYIGSSSLRKSVHEESRDADLGFRVARRVL